MIEVLEDRTVPSTDWYVNATTDTDTGDLATHTGDLRFCINNALSGDDIYFEVGGTIELTSQLTVGQSILGILGSGNIIDGQHNTRLFEISGATTINNLTLTGGNGSGGDGGAILADAGSALSMNQDTFIDNSAVNGGAIAGGVSADLCTFTSNTASLNGGAIANSGSAAVTGCTFTSNTAGGSGGAIENTGELTLAADSNHPPQPVFNTFTTNTAVTGGGAIDSSGGGQGQAGIHESNFYGNTAANGGAVSTNDPTDLETDTFGSEAQPNTATASGGNGGAVYALLAPNAMSEQMSVNNSTFAYNQAAGSGSGGAIYTTMSLDAEWGDTFTANIAPNGGGGAIEADTPAGGMGMLPQVTIAGAVFQNNQVTGGDGAAIRVQNPLSLTDNTFTNNTAKAANGVGGNGGGVAVGFGAQTTLDGCTFTTNSADAAGGAIENHGMLTVGSSANNTPAFTSNTSGADGGAIDSDAVATGGWLNVSNAAFLGNRSFRGSGGAINTADPTVLQNDAFGDKAGATPNVAAVNGGAVSTAVDAKPTTTLNVWDSFFNWNRTASAVGTGGAIDTSVITDVERTTFFKNQGTFGGAIAYTVSNANGPAFNSSLTVTQDLFDGNSPFSRLTGNGGAIRSSVTIGSGSVNVTVTNSTFTNNGVGPGGNPGTTNNGGAVDIEHNTSGSASTSATLTNDTFFANTASVRGGGLAFFLTNTSVGQNTVALTSLTVNNNRAATEGGGMFFSAASNWTVTTDNNIFDGNLVNAAGYNGPLDVTLPNNQVLVDSGFNLVDVSDTMFTALAGDRFGNIGLANALADNNALPGYQQTLALAANSDGYDNGDQSLAGQLDERGHIRRSENGWKVSIGAEDPDAS
jgi:predicted outer membrane repeat protein